MRPAIAYPGRMAFITVTNIGEDHAAPTTGGTQVILNSDHIEMIEAGSMRQRPGAANGMSSKIAMSRGHLIVRESPEELIALLGQATKR
jgi:hypothetical protein